MNGLAYFESLLFVLEIMAFALTLKRYSYHYRASHYGLILDNIKEGSDYEVMYFSPIYINTLFIIYIKNISDDFIKTTDMQVLRLADVLSIGGMR